MDGAILKTLEPEKVIKLNLDEVNLGYLYIEKYDLENDTDVSSFSMSASSFVSYSTFSSGSTTITTSTLDYFNSSDLGNKKTKNIKERLLADLFVKGISKKLDKKIIEANPQFKEIIYQLIKEDYLLNKKIKIFHIKILSYSVVVGKNTQPIGNLTMVISDSAHVANVKTRGKRQKNVIYCS